LAFQSDPALQERIGRAMARPVVLEAVAETTLPRLPASWTPGLAAALADPAPEVRLQAVRTVATLGLADFDARLAELAEGADEPPAIRMDALRALVARRPAPSPAALDFLLGQVAAGGEAVARLAAAEVLRRASLEDAGLARVLRSLRGDGLISPSLFLPALAKAGPPALAEAAESVRAGWRPSPAELGPLMDRLPADARALVAKAGGDAADVLARFEPLLRGGDPEKGREVF